MKIANGSESVPKQDISIFKCRESEKKKGNCISISLLTDIAQISHELVINFPFLQKYRDLAKQAYFRMTACEEGR